MIDTREINRNSFSTANMNRNTDRDLFEIKSFNLGPIEKKEVAKRRSVDFQSSHGLISNQEKSRVRHTEPIEAIGKAAISMFHNFDSRNSEKHYKKAKPIEKINLTESNGFLLRKGASYGNIQSLNRTNMQLYKNKQLDYRLNSILPKLPDEAQIENRISKQNLKQSDLYSSDMVFKYPNNSLQNISSKKLINFESTQNNNLNIANLTSSKFFRKTESRFLSKHKKSVSSNC
jgi:hypothetical protein